jgi:hypothetical protein
MGPLLAAAPSLWLVGVGEPDGASMKRSKDCLCSVARTARTTWRGK